MTKTFFFYDLETSGLNAREDRIMQFAGQRTDMELNPIGKPVNMLVRITNDTLPSPGAIMVTKITPQDTLRDGITEAKFVRYVTEEIFVPNTIAVGYNTIRFDDEFMRATLWRNFYDAYEWEWKDGRSRWDILDVVRLVRALRPEGINWPVREDGVPTNRLELITKLNGVTHEHAHDALSDVYATIAVAKLISDKQPKMFEYLLKMRDKKEIRKLVNLENKQPVVYASGRYANEHNKTTVVLPLTSGRNGNVLVYDLRYNLDELLAKMQDSDEIGEVEKSKKSVFPVVKCPAVAPVGVLESNDGWNKIGLTRELIEANMKTLLNHPEFAEQMRTKWEEKPEYPPAIEPEAALYDGFLNNTDRIKVAAVRNADANKLADFHPNFTDQRLPKLLLHYKGRNYPESMSESETLDWEEYRKKRIERLAPKFLKELSENYHKDEYVGEELKLYFERLLDY